MQRGQAPGKWKRICSPGGRTRRNRPADAPGVIWSSRARARRRCCGCSRGGRGTRSAGPAQRWEAKAPAPHHTKKNTAVMPSTSSSPIRLLSETQEEARLPDVQQEVLDALEALGLDRLKAALLAAGLKCGGTLHERAARLWSTRGRDRADWDPKVFVKGAAAPLCPSPTNSSDAETIASSDAPAAFRPAVPPPPLRQRPNPLHLPPPRGRAESVSSDLSEDNEACRRRRSSRWRNRRNISRPRRRVAGYQRRLLRLPLSSVYGTGVSCVFKVFLCQNYDSHPQV